MIGTIAALLTALTLLGGGPGDSFAHWETPQVHPLDLAPDGATLLALNTADARLLIFDVSGAAPQLEREVPVGIDPVSVRWFSADRAWVVNHVSDTLSVVDLSSGRVIETIQTADEPADVVFAGNPLKAFVSCSQANLIQVFSLDPATGLPTGAPTAVPLGAEDPRALAVSPDRGTVYAAIFESGNGTTILGGGLFLGNGSYPPNAVGDPGGPWAGVNPPPNAGTAFVPAQTPGLPAPPEVGLVVRRDDQGRWFDDNGGDWTRYVSGDRANRSGRRTGWDLLDRDVAAINASTLQVSYLGGDLNAAMAMAVRPSDGRVTVVGTDALNERRFEPNLMGTFLTVEMATFDFAGSIPSGSQDLNPHLLGQGSSVPPAARRRSVGDPRGIVWTMDGTRGWISGMGSNNVIEVDRHGARVGAPIAVGEGPTGLALDSAGGRLFVLERFGAGVSVIDTGSGSVTAGAGFYDPTPEAIRLGRPLLYNTQLTSGTGAVSCASCHIDARTDRLSWDLGDPSGDMVPFEGNCRDGQCEDWHPMKGPMLTQTLQDIVGKEPHHWRGDRAGVEAFAPAFHTILGDQGNLSGAEVALFEDFLATIRFPPNPNRALDNSLPTQMPLDGHYTTGRFASPGQPLPDGNAQRGLELYRPPNFLDGVACSHCHTLPTGMGSNTTLIGGTFVENPPGPLGERHHPVTSGDGSSQRHFKIPQLRNLNERTGFDTTQLTSTAGFGFLHDGSIDSIARFVGQPAFGVQSDQDIADLVAFMLAFSGSELPMGSATDLDEPPGTLSFDTHAAVGAQVTLPGPGSDTAARLTRLDALEQLARSGQVGLIAHGTLAGEPRGFVFDGQTYRSDRAAESYTAPSFRALPQPGAEITWTAVVTETAERMGVDRDLDTALDQDELDAGTDPTDPLDRPLGIRYCTPAVPNSTGQPSRIQARGSDLISINGLVLSASQLPREAFGYFLNSQDQGQVPSAGGSAGTLCLGGAIGRFNAQVKSSGPKGRFQINVDLSSLPQPTGAVSALPGETWHFQAWHRDFGGTNFTDALSITLR